MADIVAIDDEKEWRELYAEGLAEVGHTVRTFGDGSEALDDIGRKVPDLVILDIRMAPSGRQMLRVIRRHWPELPVVISSAYGGYRHDPDFVKADAFVDKSTDPNELISTIESVLSQTQAAQLREGA